MLADAHWMKLEPLIETCRPKGKTPPQDLRRTISALVWRHQMSGGIRTGPRGAPSRLSLVPGRERLRPSSAGPPWACGSGCCSWPKSVGPRAWGSTRDDGSGRHQPSGAPQGGGRGKKGATSKGRDEREALGRSRGGSGTKACVIADVLGRAVDFIRAPGQAHELPHAVPLLDRLPGVPKWVV